MNWLRRHGVLILILLVALAVRVTLSVERDRWPFSEDEHHWERLGLLYSTHGILSDDTGTYRPPLYPLLISLLYSAFGASALLVRIVQSLAAVATIWVIYLFTRRVAPERVALVAAAFAALYPLSTFMSAMMMAETLLILLTGTAGLLAIRFIEHPTIARGFPLGLVLGAGVLCKPIVLPWALLIAAGLWIRSGGLPTADRANAIVSVIAGALIVVAPWTVRNEVVTGHRLIVSSNLGMNLMIGHEPGARGQYIDGKDYVTMFERTAGGRGDAVERDRAVAKKMWTVIQENPLRSVRLAGRKLWLFWNSVLSDGPRWAITIHFLSGTSLVLFGIYGLMRNRDHDAAWMAIGAALCWSIVHAIFFSHARFRLPVDVLWMPFAAAGLVACFDSVKAAVTRRLGELDAA